MKLRILVSILLWVVAACSSSGGEPGVLGEDTGTSSTMDVSTDLVGIVDSGATTTTDLVGIVDSTSSGDAVVAPPQDTATGPQSDGAGSVDTGGPIQDTSVPMEFDPSGLWLLVANPSSQEFCGAVQNFDDQVLVLSVSNSGVATATLEPPEWFLTINFEGTFAGMQLEMEAAYAEEGPPSIGWATEHKHIIDVTFSSPTNFAGNYIHELVPNVAAPCTRLWNITGTKQ